MDLSQAYPDLQCEIPANLIGLTRHELFKLYGQILKIFHNSTMMPVLNYILQQQGLAYGYKVTTKTPRIETKLSWVIRNVRTTLQSRDLGRRMRGGNLLITCENISL